MIVAAGAANGKAKNALANRAQYFVELILTSVADGRFVATDLAGLVCSIGNQKTQGRILPNRITGNLLKDELVIGLVLV